MSTIQAISRFEYECEGLKYGHCLCCRQVKLGLVVNRNGVCIDCSKKRNPHFYEDQKMLPIWYENGVVQYRVPPQLSCLSMAEKMLIQMASPFIPLRHIKNGVFGLSGHVCCFDQDLESFVNTLPRKATDVLILQVLKEAPMEFGGECTRTSCYKVRRKHVGEALVWLKEYNAEYKHIEIDMSALDWLQGEEGSLEVLALHDSEVVNEKAVCVEQSQQDFGPCPSMTKTFGEGEVGVKTFGFVDESPGNLLSPDDIKIHNAIVDEVDHSTMKRDIYVQWPTNGPVAINEYGSTKIFARAFPWLFPGGIGDVKDCGDDLQKWGQRLLYYEDGRFATDKYFTFYALNYITRHRNNKSGSWFIRGFNKNGPQNLEELKESIRSGDKQFINRLMYYNQSVLGSSTYWHKKKSEVYAWMNHHVEIGHGPPNLFITLSCAEYYWPDILRLIRQKMDFVKDDRVKECVHGSKKVAEIVNDYTIVVQEYFQERFNKWMEFFGRPIFGISHFWGRYEFAPGRGQIHIHLLAIRADQSIFKLCYEDLKFADGKSRRDLRLGKWAEDNFCLTASVGTDFQDRICTPDNSPCTVRFRSILGDKDVSIPNLTNIHEDQQNLLRFCQVHDCNGFCLRLKDNRR
jgi:hypothetical protein